MSKRLFDLEKIKSIVNDDEKFEQIKNELEKIDLFSETLKNVTKIHSFLDNFSFIKNLSSNKNEIFSNSVETITGFGQNYFSSVEGGFLSLVFSEDLDWVQKKLLEFESDPNSEKLSGFKFRIVTKKKNVIWVKLELIKIKSPKDETFVIGVVSDINDYIDHYEKAEKKLEEIETKNSAKDKFISIISHDLRAPFTSLLGFSEILMNENELPESEKEEYLKYIYDASSNQLNLINYLLDWSRLQTGRLNIEKRRLNVRQIIAHSRSNLSGVAYQKKVNIHVDVNDSLFIDADERLIVQAISNLLSNAVKFTPDGKNIFISASKFKDGLIEIIVKDEGVGIDEKDHEKLFRLDEKFSRNGTNGEKGTGFGLTLVKDIVEKHGGDVWFYSKLNEGTEFHITIQEAKNLILIVEDDEAIRSLYSRMINNELTGFSSLETDNGYEALSELVSQTPSLIIVDHSMPLMNGIQLIEAMRQKYIQKDIPVIIVSGVLTDEIRKVYESLGVSTIITKPFDYKELVAKVKLVLQV